MRWHITTIVAVVFWSAATALGTSVTSYLAADGRYAIYTGTAAGTDLMFVGDDRSAPATIAPKLQFEMEDERYIYVAVWGSPLSCRGLLAEFMFNGLSVRSGDPAWETYRTPYQMPRAAERPPESAVGTQIRNANRQYEWASAAVVAGNGAAGPAVETISHDAAWMWMPAGEEPASTEPCCVLFRIAPAIIWPEIELWHTPQTGMGTMSGGAYVGKERFHPGGFRGGRRSSGGGLSSGGSYDLPGVEGWTPDEETPSELLDPREPPEYESSDPVLPPEDDTDDPNVPTTDPPERTPVPEPASGLLMTCGAVLLLRRGR